MHVDVEVGDRCESVMEHVLKEDDRKATVANLRSQCQVLTAKQIKIQNRLEQWRNQFTVQQAKTQNKNNKQSNNFTMGVLCSGGCLDTLAGMRAGFKPIWCTEIDHEQQEMFRDLTRGETLGDTFGDRAKTAEDADYWKSGQPCPNYSMSGSETSLKQAKTARTDGCL